MWQRYALNGEQRHTTGWLTLPALTSNNTPLTSNLQLQDNKILRFDRTVWPMGKDISEIPGNVHGTMRHLSTRHREVSQWQTLMFESIDHVNQEITALEQLKKVVECFLEDNQLYSLLTHKCLAICTSLKVSPIRQDDVYCELRKEEQLTNEVKELLQRQICILMDILGSLKNIREKLKLDYEDKREAIKLTTRCFTEVSTLTSHVPSIPYKPNQVSYETWLAHCMDLRQAAEDLVKNSCAFRAKLRLTLDCLKNSREQQRQRIHDAMKKKIHELNGIQNALLWEKQQINEEIADLTEKVHKLGGQIQNCEARLLLVNRRLEILNQRPGYELCLDNLYISLLKEREDLKKMLAGLCLVFENTQQDLQMAQRRRLIVEDKLAENGRALEVEQTCLDMHQSYKPIINNIVVNCNRPKLPKAMSFPSPHATIQ